MPISDEERARRERQIAEANASAALDRVAIDPTTAELQAQWARGEISEHEMIARARVAFAVPEPTFSAASPYEIAQRYAADGWDSLIVDVPGTHTEEQIVRAWHDGLIDEDIYVEIGEATRTVT